MENKHQVHNLIILDESGSMNSVKKATIQGFNETVQTIKGIEKQYPEQEHFISLITFNGVGQKLQHFIDPANKLKELDERQYTPNASTPLFDAMGFGINKLKQVLESRKDYNVLVTILTDGEENASREYSGKAIKELIEELKLKNWTFTYIGTDHDVEGFAKAISIENTLFYKKSDAGMLDMFDKERKAREKYSQKIRVKEDTSKDYFDPEEPKK